MAENYMPKYRAAELDVTRELSRVETIIITTIACFQVKLVVLKKTQKAFILINFKFSWIDF